MSHPITRHCVRCGAEPGQPCVGKRGQRKAYHRGRGSRVYIDRITSHRLAIESPIEDALVANILGWIEHFDINGIEVTTQVPVGPYRADILVQYDGRQLVVECDGGKFHNNPEAVAHDKRRDRYFVLQGIAVMRFTGVEIQRDPRGCAAEVGMWILRR